MSPHNTSSFGTAFCESIDAPRRRHHRHLRRRPRPHHPAPPSIRNAGPQDLARPGHIFPLRARNGGVLVRAGQTEACVDLARIAGLDPSRRDLRNHER